MILPGLGDGARYATFVKDSSALRQDLDRLSNELSSGRKSDIPAALGSELSFFSDVQRSLRLNESYLTGLATAAATTAARQTALERLEAEIETAGPALLTVVGTGKSDELQLRLADAPARFEGAINAVNTRFANQSLFSGDQPDQPALIDAEVILTDLRLLIAAAPDAATAVADIDSWFNDAGGGYETVAMLGGASGGATVYLGEEQTADAGVTAADPAIRKTMAGLAIAVLAAEGSVPTPPGARFEMASAAAERMLQAERLLVDTRARLGVAEGRIETARVQAEATRSSLQLEEVRMTSADPYTTATEIENVSRKLESLYLLTSRLSSLSLTNFLR